MNKKQLLEILELKNEKELKALYEISQHFTPEELERIAKKIPGKKKLIINYL